MRVTLLLVFSFVAIDTAGCTTAWTRHMNHGSTALWAGSDAELALEHFERAVAAVAESDPRHAIALSALGHAQQRAGRPGDAEATFRHSLAPREDRFGLDVPLLLIPLSGLAAVLQEDPSRASERDEILDRIVAIHEADREWTPAEPRPRFAYGRALADAGSLLLRADRREEAEEHFERAVPLLLDTDPRLRVSAQLALDDYLALLRTTGREERADALLGPVSSGPDYLRYVAFKGYFGESFLSRWPENRMPLRIHLPLPQTNFFRDPESVLDSVRDGILDWTDVVRPGVPSFVFVDEPGDADIPIVWSPAVTAWFTALASLRVDRSTRRFGVSQILVAARYAGGSEVPLAQLYQTMLHEVGHALGLGGHSPDPGDAMSPYSVGSGAARGLSDRDRATLRALYATPIGHRIAGARRAD